MTENILDFSSEINKFPDRTEAIKFHKQSVLNALATGNIELANLSFAKLVESIRQQNINSGGTLNNELALLREVYDLFRNKHSLEYPKQFLPPKEKITKEIREGRIEESYLRFDGPLNPRTPKDFIQLLDTIKRKSEWETMGFKLKADTFGNYKPVRKSGLFFGFSKITQFNEITEKALKTGKKYTTYPKNIIAFLDYGCSYEDFVSISDDIKAYYETHKHYKNGQFELAMVEIKKALVLNPTEKLYKELFFDIKFELKDISAIEGDIAYHIETYGGISAMTHSEKIDRWIKLLYKLDEYQKAMDIINTINHLFDQEIAEKSVYKKQEGVKYIVDGSELAGEQLANTEHYNKIRFVEYCKEKFNNRISKLKDKTLKKIQN